MEDGREGSNECRYTLPGVLHFLQHDWSRFELERVQWDAEKAELTAKIAFLQGERRGQENIKRDLIRRIKMLEFALKKERIKGIFIICQHISDNRLFWVKDEAIERFPRRQALSISLYGA